MEFDKQLELLDELVECYRAKRKAHSYSNWLTLKALWGRVSGRNLTFDRLRNSDLIFLQRAHSILRLHLRNSELSQMELVALSLYLKNHRSFIAERDFFLVVYAAMIGVFLLVPRDCWFAGAMVGMTVLIGVLAVYERWNMKRNDSIYNELVEFIQNEADAKRA